jgi:hypothetical protein
MASGSISLWFAGAEHADRAQALVEQLGLPVARP